MSGLQQKRKKVQWEPEKGAPDLRRAVKHQLAAAAGAEYFSNRDPVYHITEDFQKTFDLLGAHRTRQLGGLQEEGRMESAAPGLEEFSPRRQEQEAEQPGLWPEAREEEAGLLEKSDMSRMVSPSPYGGDRMFLSRFSEVAFNRGKMAGAVLRGTGKMMLFSCLKRTVGQSGPTDQRQRKLFEAGSQRRNIAGAAPDQVIFNRGQVEGAVGLVVDVLRDARRVVDSMSKLAEGKNVLQEGSGAETLRKTYPFLSDTQEKGLLEDYRKRLSGTQSPQEKEILQHAIVKTQALLDKKNQMKQRFITELRSVSERAQEALAVFTQPGFSDELFEQLTVQPEPPSPPDEEREDENQSPEEGKRP